MNIGIINLSVELGEAYSEELKKNDCHVVLLTTNNFEKRVDGCDVVIICENAEQDTAQTCSVLLKLKEKSDASVWVFSSNIQKIMRTVYLQLGVRGVLTDDYGAKDLELVISNNLKRTKVSDSFEMKEKNSNDDEILNMKKISLVPRNFSVKIDGKKEIPLTRLEYKIMELLYENRNNAVTYEELFESVWGKGFNNQNYRVANLIFHLRGKIEDDAVNSALIRTVRSKGYMLELKK